ncbi:MAG: hypothetical protein V4478_00920 [Patescibacteria group bacterium]
MEKLKILGAIVGLVANIPLFIAVWKGLKQNFSTWILWTMLDVITTIAIINQHGNYYLSGIYVFTSLAMSILLFVKKEISWGLTDTVTAVGVCICLIVWYFMGDNATTIASTAAVVISAYPLMRDTFISPDPGATKVYCMFIVASLLSLLAAKDTSVEEWLYPAATMSFSAVLTIFSIRKPTEFRIVH